MTLSSTFVKPNALHSLMGYLTMTHLSELVRMRLSL